VNQKYASSPGRQRLHRNMVKLSAPALLSFFTACLSSFTTYAGIPCNRIYCNKKLILCPSKEKSPVIFFPSFSVKNKSAFFPADKQLDQCLLKQKIIVNSGGFHPLICILKNIQASF